MIRFSAFITALLLVIPSGAHSQVDRSYLPLSISYLLPRGALADTLDVQPGIGFSLGYNYALDRNWRIGAKGTWMWSKLGNPSSGDLSSYSATYYQVLATITWRPIKHGWSPYIQGEGGLGFLNLDEEVGNMPIPIEGASAVQGSVGASLGVVIPLSDALDVDVHGRYNFAFIESGYSVVGVHVGVVYLLAK